MAKKSVQEMIKESGITIDYLDGTDESHIDWARWRRDCKLGVEKRNNMTIAQYFQMNQPKRGKGHTYIEKTLRLWTHTRGYALAEEYKFHKDRKFRFDWAIPAIGVAVEYEGVNAVKSRHTTKKGYSNDCIKYNLAAIDGWIVLRFTAMNYIEIDRMLDMIEQNIRNRTK